MEAALWGALSARMGDDPRGHAPPDVFLNRIKRLLELDTKQAAGIFAVKPPGGSGNAAAYDPFGVFLMALGLVFLDGGFKQSDVIFVLRHIKDQLRAHYEKIANSKIDLHQQLAASDRPGFPHKPGRPFVADQSAFLIIAKVEMRECWSGDNLPDPFFLGPTICYGVEELQKYATRINWQMPSRFIVEIAGLATLTRRHLFRNELVAVWERNIGKSVGEGKSGKIFEVETISEKETEAQPAPRIVSRKRLIRHPKAKPAAS
jgi:hypothetical protein